MKVLKLSNQIHIYLQIAIALILLLSTSCDEVSNANDINNCDDLVPYLCSKTEILSDYIDKNIHQLSLKSQACIALLVKNAKFESLDLYLSHLAKNGINYRESLNMSINTLKKTLEEVHNKHRFDQKEYQTIFPAFQWAQSLDDVYLELKFSNRHDTPGCLEMKDINVKIEVNTVSFVGYCFLGDVPIKIDFFIQTWQDINRELSTHDYGSVGKYHITLKKAISGMYWDKLLSNKSPQPSNMRVWWEMKEKFADQLKKYEEEGEENEFNKEVEEIKKQASEKKEKRRKKSKKNIKKKDNSNTTNTTNTGNNSDNSVSSKKTDL